MADGPDPTRVSDLPGLAEELGLLRVRAARGTGRPIVSLAELTRRMGLPATSKSTVHSHATGRTLAPAEALDAMVIALGATPDEQRAWAEAWFRVAASRHGTRPAAAVPGPGREDSPPAAPPAVRARPRYRAAALVVVLVLVVGADLPARTAPHPDAPAAIQVVDLPHRPPFLAKLRNAATGKCLSRNGAFTHPADSEKVGQAVYQWECAASDNPGHHLVIAPVGTRWQIRSSTRTALCLAADGAPGDEQRYRQCDTADDRYLWTIQGAVPDSMTIRNHDTGLCLAHQGGDPDIHIRVLQRPCATGDDARWRIEDYPPLNSGHCPRTSLGVRNHESGHVLPVVMLPSGPTAHGCAVTIERSGRCLTADARWSACTPGHRWIPEWVGEVDGELWTRLHSATTTSRCLEATPEPRVVPCDEEWDQQWSVENP
ncbi:RICIN domain-containing protein [Actinokineospora guangxiensis]|uniref:RICIN domain-containing protein n=1 Tax=Actinokineospora guangxiensis TaxID=1490288 RepID=A0ABW0ET61_9PSEU